MRNTHGYVPIMMAGILFACVAVGHTQDITGELMQWHTVTLSFDGPSSSEDADPNPFLYYRMNVTFTKGSKSYVVPGYYAADGDAANTNASAGATWRVHFCPDETGTWNYEVSFRQGTEVAVSDDPSAGSAYAALDGATGQFDISATDKSGRDFRGKGRLKYTGEHYLQFAGTGDYFLKQGADAPENFLAYEDFDGNFKSDGHNDTYVKSWSAHVSDYNSGDPTWDGDKGKGIIGAINYLASEEMNAFSFLTMNIQGDDQNVFPYTDYNERLRMDVSRLAQWEIVFSHADEKGMFLHFKTQETENDQLLDGGDLGTQRKLYYRELIARFSHHLALNWNLGEENTNTDSQRKAFAAYFHEHDPYQHHIVIHTYPGQKDAVYTPLLGSASELTGASLQTSSSSFTGVHSAVATWVQASADAGQPWAVACDEPGDASHAMRPDNDAGTSHEDGRKNGLWGTFMAGGWGNEWYFGYQHAHSDLTCEDFRSRDAWWDYCRYALAFFNDNDIPFWEMSGNDDLVTGSDTWCFAKLGEVYVVYLPEGGTADLDLSGQSGEYSVKWYNPRQGGSLLNGSLSSVTGGSQVSIGSPPQDASRDWVVLVASGGYISPASVWFVEPSTNATISTDSTLTVEISASTDSGSIDSVVLRVDGTTEQSVQSTSLSTSMSDLSAGTHELTAMAYVDYGDSAKASRTVTVYDMSNVLFFRAEDGILSDGMSSVSDADALSDHAISGNQGNTSAPQSGDSKAEYAILFPAEGTWYAWGRFSYPDDQNNSFWIVVDGGSARRFGNGQTTYDQYHWEGYMSQGAIDLGNLSAGTHTITIYSREAHADNLLDALCVTTNPNYTPTDGDVMFQSLTGAQEPVIAGKKRSWRFRLYTAGGAVEVTLPENMTVQEATLHAVDGSVYARGHVTEAGRLRFEQFSGRAHGVVLLTIRSNAGRVTRRFVRR